MAKSIIKNPRIIFLIVVIILAIVAIHPSQQKGVAIRYVIPNGTANQAGIQSPKPGTPPMSKEVILSINNIPTKTLNDYYNIIESLKTNITIQVKTNKNIYRVKTQEINGKIDLGIRVYDAPTSNIRKGLDIEGGTRVLLKPEKKISKDDMELVISSMKQRLNVYGLTDIIIRKATDLSGNQYVITELAGVNEEEVKDLISKQGKFEAKIGNDTVFIGGKKDITHVCRSADCSGIDPNYGCSQSDKGWVCRFRFTITLSPKAAQRQANLTKDLKVVKENDQEYLSKDLTLYLDDVLVDSLKIGADLKGRVVTDIQISGSGVGSTKEEAVYNTLQNMKRLQTILITGSLPVKMQVVKTDALSPTLGKQFLKNALVIGVLALLAVTLVVFIRFKKPVIVIPMLITMLSEVIILLGFAALTGWNLDIAAIAGIIVAVGTGVDDQIVITDETIKGEKEAYGWKERIKKAFFIIMGSYFTTVVAMIPLLLAGAGLIKGFAFTTIVGVTIGVFITRPAFATMVEHGIKRKEK